MIKVRHNGKWVTLPVDTHLAQALEEWRYVPETFAVAINGNFVSRQQYASISLQSGDEVDVVSAMQGG